MASCFQAVPLVAAPSYPNAVAWSEENLIAVASGHLVTILNPALPFGPRGLITIPTIGPFPVGEIKKEDFLSGCLLPICLSRDRQPCVQSISWSPLGLAPNGGCLLAVCTTEGCVKLYHPPFCHFGAEWIEVMDISNMLCGYLASVSFGESDVPFSKYSDVREREHDHPSDLPNLVTRMERKHRKRDAPSLNFCNNKHTRGHGDQLPYQISCEDSNPVSNTPDFELQGLPTVNERNAEQTLSVGRSKEKPASRIHDTLPSISANQYASRSSLLSSLVVAWSPVLQLLPKTYAVSINGSSFSILAVGGKSGKVSLWKIYVPEYCSIEDRIVPTRVVLVGLLQAHKSWITTLTWALLDSNSSHPKVLLTTGSPDGSVKIWLGYTEELLASSETNFASFALLKEVITVDAVPASVLSLLVPAQSPKRTLLAVGKQSGSLEVWICDISSENFDRVGSYDAHDHIVTGLAWAFDGHCLYSCSEDNFVRSWSLNQSSLKEVHFPSNISYLRSSSDLPEEFLSCFGLAVSPGSLVVAVVRNFDIEELNQMYQARSMKAAVEYYWIGGQQIDSIPKDPSDFHSETLLPSENEMSHWDSNLLWSLRQFENLDKPLVMWDVIAALLVFKDSLAKYVEHILIKWLDSSSMGNHIKLSAKENLLDVEVSKIPTRQLHMLNIICRRVILSELKPDQINNRKLCTEEEDLNLRIELLLRNEREVRQRLVGLSFSTCGRFLSHSDATPRPRYWYPFGLAQMERWVALNHDNVHDSLKVLISELGECQKRSEASEHVEAEQCSYCSASVPFESPEFAFCQGVDRNKGAGKKSHKLARCSVSMQVCPTSPLWFCPCCHRSAFRLAPATLFIMSEYNLEFKSSTKTSDLELPSMPLCPFCGILLQRRQPDFLLSASPV